MSNRKKEFLRAVKFTLFSASAGIIQAAARMRPAGITDMEISSFMKKFKDKKFAAKCDREIIKAGCDMLGMEVRDVASICIEAMKQHAEELQIGPKE